MMRVVRAVTLVTTFLVALVLGVFAHINTAPLRRDAVARVNQVLAPLFAGKVILVSFGHLGLHGVDGVSARVADPEGKTVIVADGVRVRADVVAIVRSAALGTGPIDIDLREVSVRSSEIVVDADEHGAFGIARAFVARTPSTSAQGRGVKFALDHLTVDHAWVHGTPVSGLPVDADVDALRAKVLVASSSTAVDVESLTLTTRGMPHGANAKGTLQAHLGMPSANGAALGVSAEWKGAIAGIDDSMSASLDGDAISAVVDAPQISPDAIRALWPASTIAESASLHLDANGTLTRVKAHAHATLGAASVDLSGPIAMASGQHADIHIDLRALDLNAIVPSIPLSSLGASGDVSLTRSPEGALQGEAKIDLERGLIAGQPVPSGVLHSAITYDPHAGLRADARLTAHEPGAPTVLGLHVMPKPGGGLQVVFDGDVNAPKLAAVPRLASAVQGSSALKSHGVFDVERGEIVAKVRAELDDVGGGGVVHAKHASIVAGASGTLGAPKLDATIHGDLLDIAKYRFSTLQVEAHGHAKKLHLSVRLAGDGAPDVEVDADLDLGVSLGVSNLEVTLARNDDRIHASIPSLRIARGGVDADDVAVTGLGGVLHLSLHTSQGALRVKGDGRDLDLPRLLRILGVDESLIGCQVALGVDAIVKRDGAEGTASFDVGACALDKVKGVTAHLDAKMTGRKISGHAHVDVPEAGAIDFVTTSVAIGGTAPVLASWRRAWGRVKFDGHMDLAKLAPLLPPGALPVDDVRGTMTVEGELERDAMDDMTPGVRLSLKTAGLSLVGASKRITDVDGATTIVPPSWHSQGIDVAIDSRIDGDSGFADLAVTLDDAHGELVDLDLKSATVPYANLLANPAQSLQTLEAVQFNARINVPKRSLSTLPPMIAIDGGRGELEGVVTVAGSALMPIIDADVKLTQARARSVGFQLPADLDVTAHYDGSHLDANLKGSVRNDPVVDATLSVNIKAADLLAGNTSVWTGSSHARLKRFPIESLAALSEHQISGVASGEASVDDLHKDAKAKLDLTLNDLKVGDVTYVLGKLGGTLTDGAMNADLRFDQVDGFIDAHAHAGAKWGTAILPTLDPTKDLDCRLRANRFRAAMLLPYVDNVFTELDARMDADVTAQLDPRTRTARINGTIDMTEGRFELASIGGEFHDASMKVTFTPDGIVRVENVKASGMSGQLEAAATIRLNNLVPVAASANIEIPSANPLLLTVEGSQVGTLVGKMSITAQLSADRNKITANVDVPSLHVELPLTSSQDVQALGDIDGVRIGTNGPRGFVPERLDAAKVELAAPSNKSLEVAITLGKDVEVKKGATLKVALDGKPTITVTDVVRAGGRIRLARGTIDVQGKSFEVENGTVTFVGDPTNPQVVVTASNTAADGTRIYADFVGPLKTGKVTLRSDPTLPQNEILALLLFGTADGLTPGSQSTSAGTTGAGVAGSAAAEPLNRALESYGLGGVTTRVDTSQANPRPEVMVQIARDISLQVAYVIGTPPPGQNPDPTLFTLNWHFVKQWSLEATVGSLGTSILDLIWQYRY